MNANTARCYLDATAPQLKHALLRDLQAIAERHGAPNPAAAAAAALVRHSEPLATVIHEMRCAAAQKGS